MRSDTDIADDDLQALAEVRDFSLALARRFQAAALAEEDDEKAMRLARSVHRAERSLRQSVLMRHKLRREQRLDAYAVARAAREDAVARGSNRKMEVERAVRQMIRLETEGAEAVRLRDELSERLQNAKYFEGFADRPLQDHIAALRAEIGLDAPRPCAVESGPEAAASNEGVEDAPGAAHVDHREPAIPTQAKAEPPPAAAPEPEPAPAPAPAPPPPPVPKWLSDAYDIERSVRESTELVRIFNSS